ncbi:hypothetical protein JW921_07585 [Candidatus Fermentibacterales bacterium]|nr:hypothetical protein [Candidatus Fermentibacterales bacterium]
MILKKAPSCLLAQAMALLLLVPGLCQAFPGLEPSGLTLYDNSGSKWFVPTISHRVYLGYTTGSSGSWSTGAYTGVLGFDLTTNLRAELSLGVAQHLLFSRGSEAREFMGEVLLDWRPVESLRLQLNIGGVIPDRTP